MFEALLCILNGNKMNGFFSIFYNLFPVATQIQKIGKLLFKKIAENEEFNPLGIL